MLGDSIDVHVDSLENVQECLNIFYELIPTLYGPGLCTMNMHSLIHLVRFGCESLKQHLHGTRSILSQVVIMARMKQSLSLQNKENLLTNEVSIIAKVCKRNLPPAYSQLLRKLTQVSIRSVGSWKKTQLFTIPLRNPINFLFEIAVFACTCTNRCLILDRSNSFYWLHSHWLFLKNLNTLILEFYMVVCWW